MVDRQTSKEKSAARVMIVDDHPAVCEGLGYRISSQEDMVVCGEAADMTEALRKIQELRPDVVIVDIALKDSDGLELVRKLKSDHKQVRALVHSMYDEVLYADRCLHVGAMGYVNKESNPDEVIRAIREVLAGRIYLSPTMTNELLGRAVNGRETHADLLGTLTDRQLEVFRLIGNGLTAHEIAKRLHISVHTVESHRENIKQKLRINTVSELTRRAVLWTTQSD